MSKTEPVKFNLRVKCMCLFKHKILLYHLNNIIRKSTFIHNQLDFQFDAPKETLHHTMQYLSLYY